MSALTFLALRRLADGRFHSGEVVARELGRSRATLSEALKKAPELGIEIFSVRGKGYRLAEPIEFLDAARVQALLGDSRVRIEVLDEVASTSTRLLEMAAAGAPSGTCVAAEWQSAGRGRRGRSWVSALGGSLTFSLLWRFERGAGHLGGLSLAVGLAVARALAACGVARAQVKWPNDVVADFRKLAGILVETSGEMQGPSVAVIGVGVNYRLGERVVDRIDQPVTDVAHCCASLPARGAVLAALLRELASTLEAFDRDGFAAHRDAWLAMHAYQARRVRVVPARDPPFEATVTGVAPDGALLVATDDGRTLPLSSAEISLRSRTVGSDPTLR
ncbi:MAG TPA: biotin--[acetyl-CoA-carboxylase] ligase [Usitatibacter sp.]|nr:biotin--[acetyl-CoA-carboxylase] ligase [Usitatibacter sp.]